MRESDTQRAILDYLALKRIFHYRNNSGAFKDTQNHFYGFGALGSPDIICVIDGLFVGIEVKAAKKASRASIKSSFNAWLERAGGKYILAYSLDDVIREIEIALKA